MAAVSKSTLISQIVAKSGGIYEADDLKGDSVAELKATLAEFAETETSETETSEPTREEKIIAIVLAGILSESLANKAKDSVLERAYAKALATDDTKGKEPTKQKPKAPAKPKLTFGDTMPIRVRITEFLSSVKPAIPGTHKYPVAKSSGEPWKETTVRRVVAETLTDIGLTNVDEWVALFITGSLPVADFVEARNAPKANAK